MKKAIALLCMTLGLGHVAAIAQSAKSDSLFATGVDLYQAGKYKEAIPLFAESDRLDKEELDSTSNRRDYSAMWLSVCYYHLGDTTLSKSTSSYYYLEQPIDRRLTISSDSLLRLETDSLSEKLSLEIAAAEIEKQYLGNLNVWYGNSLLRILLDCVLLTKFDKVNDVLVELTPIFTHNKLWAYEQLDFLITTAGMLLQAKTYKDDVNKLIDLTACLSELTKVFYDLPYGDKYDNLYSSIVSLRMNTLVEANQIEQAIEIGENVRKTMIAPKPIYNNNRLYLLGSLSRLYTEIVQPSNGIDSDNLKNNIWNIYKEMEEVLVRTQGKFCYNWSEVQIAKAKFYAGKNEIEMKKHLFSAFKCYNERERTSEEKMPYMLLLNDTYSLFTSINAEKSFVDYAFQIIGNDTVITESTKPLWENIALCYKSKTVKDFNNACHVYQKLYDYSFAQDSLKDAISYLGEKATIEYIEKDYVNAIADYSTLNGIYEEKQIGTPSGHGNILMRISDCYNRYNLKDSLKYKSFKKEAIQKKKLALATNNNESSSYRTYDRYSDLINIGELIEQDYEGAFKGNLNEAIYYYQQAVDTLLQFEKEPLFKYFFMGDLMSLYDKIAVRYTYLYDFKNADNYLKRVMAQCPDSLDYNYIRLMQSYARLYDVASIEPDSSLYYYKRAALLGEERLSQKKDSLSPNELLVEIEMLADLWDKCAKQYEKIGNDIDALKCLDKRLDILSSQDSKYYFSEYISRLFKELELCSPQGIRYQFAASGEYMRKTTNSYGDYSQSKAVANSIAEEIKKKSEISAEDFRMIYLCMKLANDTVSCVKYLKNAIEATKKEHPVDFQYIDTYYESRKDLAKIEGSKEVIDYYIQQLHTFSLKRDMTKEFAFTLGDLASQYSLLNMPDSAMFYAKQYIEIANELSEDIEEDAIVRGIKIAERAKRYEYIIPYYNRYSQIAKKTLLERFKYETAEEREKSWKSYEFVPFSCGNYSAITP